MRSNEFHFPGKQNSLAFPLTVITSEEVMNGRMEGGTEGKWSGETRG